MRQIRVYSADVLREPIQYPAGGVRIKEVHAGPRNSSEEFVVKVERNAQAHLEEAERTYEVDHQRGAQDDGIEEHQLLAHIGLNAFRYKGRCRGVCCIQGQCVIFRHCIAFVQHGSGDVGCHFLLPNDPRKVIDSISNQLFE